MTPAVQRRLRALIASFERNQADCLSPQYRETQLRREFLDPCFRLLGWDIDNEAGLSAARRDVIHEDSLRTGSGLKAPDYSFRIDGSRRFFVEAKRPAVNVARDPASAYQLRRYAWSANLPLSILTDFQEWAIYDCRLRPSPQNAATVARYTYFRFDELEARWDELASLISKDAVADGSLDRFANTALRTRRMAEVDDAFLGEIEDWREVLAQDIARRNRDLDAEALNTAVQQLLDRIVFLRISEARGIEELGQLRDLAAGQHIYSELLDVFYRADSRYNSGLFHFAPERRRGTPDTLGPRLYVGDAPLRHVIRHLYYPDSPYEFTVLPGRILGQVYERFLGSQIVVSRSRKVAIEFKPQFARAGGVFYTPSYIADRIASRTVGRLLDASSRSARSHATGLRILDPACGSGSFLISAYDRLMSWHRDYYTSHEPSRFKTELYQAPDGEWRLTIAERKRIVSSNIFGVDIDPQAVETTKLSLLLKVLEGETAETVGQTLALWHDRALPDLDKNVLCGNSLCGDDVLAWVGDEMFAEHELREQLRPFEWEASFPSAFGRDNPGFDVVVGNPPYISALTMVNNVHPEVRDYWRERYRSASGAYDIYVLFVEQGLRLCRKGGLLSYIIPNKFLAAEYAREFRRFIFEDARFVELVDYSRTKVWKRSVYPVVPLLISAKPGPADKLAVSVGDKVVRTNVRPVASIARSVLGSMPDLLWSFATRDGLDTFSRIVQTGRALETIADVSGSSTVAEGSAFPASLAPLAVGSSLPREAAKFVVTGSISRFTQRWATHPISYMHKRYTRPILRLDGAVPQRRRAQALAPKLILAKVTKAPRGFADYKGEYAAGYCTYVFPQEGISASALIGILNSSLMAFAAQLLYGALAMSGGFISFLPPQLRRLPICPLTDTGSVMALEAVVRELERLHPALLEVQSERDRTRLKRDAARAEAEMNELVYGLYGLGDADRQTIGAYVSMHGGEPSDDEDLEQAPGADVVAPA
ncbi:MAG: Eco57I restriction-modification methylase domain-containing protein [Candidatus Dormibacteria bacterium]